jgi:hypothetical protein
MIIMKNRFFNSSVDATSFVRAKTDLLRPNQKQYLHDNLFSTIATCKATNDRRAIVVPADTSAGKTFTIINDTIPHYFYSYTNEDFGVFIAPELGCVEGPYEKAKKTYDNKLIVDKNGVKKRIRIVSNENYLEFVTTPPLCSEPSIFIAFVTIHTFSNAHRSRSVMTPNVAFIDEIHWGLGTPTAADYLVDHGYPSTSFEAVWYNVLKDMRELTDSPTTVVGYTGTATASQQQLTTEGAANFILLSRMPKDKDESTFAEVHYYGRNVTHENVLKNVKNIIRNNIDEVVSVTTLINPDTWDAAAAIGIEKVMPAFIMKMARNKSRNGISISTYSEILKWMQSNSIDAATSSTYSKSYHTQSKRISCDSAIDVIKLANKNVTQPTGIVVLESGAVGWDIPRINIVVNLSVPMAGYGVCMMQDQLIGRGRRLLFGITSHDEMSAKIARLEISKDQKLLVAKYVALMSTTTVVYIDSPAMNEAALNFLAKSYDHKEGMQLYIDAVEKYDSNVVNFSNAKIRIRNNKHDASKLNKLYKECQCSVCPKDPTTQVPICELSIRLALETKRGEKFDDDEWESIVPNMIQVNHLAKGRNDYSPENLQSVCANYHAIITILNNDHLCKYVNGTRVD